MTNCPFCDTNELTTRTLQESKNVRVIFSNPRLMKGHLLVTPKRHIEQPWDLTKAELNELFDHIHELQNKLAHSLGTGCDIRQNYRPFMNQGRLKIDHLHFHLLPRTFKDELYERSMKFETEMFCDLSDSEISEVTNVLKK